MIEWLHEVVETREYIRAAARAGLSLDEREEIVNYLAFHPAAGDLIRGSGGARKLRFARQGRGKRGGYRVITFYGGGDVPVFLLDVYSKSRREDLSASDIGAMRARIKTMKDERR